MKKIKYVSYLIAATFMLVGCGGSDNSASETQANTAQAENNQANKNDSSSNDKSESSLPDNAPVYKVALNPEYEPFESKDDTGNPIGYDVDLIRAIGEASGFNVTFEEMDFDALLPAVSSGKADLAISALTLTKKRQESYLPSKPYLLSQSGYLVPDSSKNIKTVEDLKGKNIAVQQDSYQHEILKQTGETIYPTDTIFLAFQSIFTKRSDAIFGEEALLFYQSSQFSDEKVRFIPHSDKTDELVIYANKSNQSLVDKINSGFDTIKNNGKYQTINKKWFGQHADTVSIK